jgi:hypothetical protein
MLGPMVRAPGALIAGPEAPAPADAALAELKTVGVPAYAVAFKRTLGAAAGQFDFPTWTMDVGKTPFEGANPGLATVAELSNYVIHESRHCEQWFRMARRTAGKGRRPLR